MRSATAAAAASPHAGAIQRLRCPSPARPVEGRSSASGAAADWLRTAAWIRSSSPAGATTGAAASRLKVSKASLHAAHPCRWTSTPARSASPRRPAARSGSWS